MRTCLNTPLSNTTTHDIVFKNPSNLDRRQTERNVFKNSVRWDCFTRKENTSIFGVKQEMIDTLKSLGYNNVTEREYGVSPIPEFNGVDNPSQIRAMHSTVVEASKPMVTIVVTGDSLLKNYWLPLIAKYSGDPKYEFAFVETPEEGFKRSTQKKVFFYNL